MLVNVLFLKLLFCVFLHLSSTFYGPSVVQTGYHNIITRCLQSYVRVSPIFDFRRTRDPEVGRVCCTSYTKLLPYTTCIALIDTIPPPCCVLLPSLANKILPVIHARLPSWWFYIGEDVGLHSTFVYIIASAYLVI